MCTTISKLGTISSAASMFLESVVEISVINYDKSDGTNMFLHELLRDRFFVVNKNDDLDDLGRGQFDHLFSLQK